MRALLATLLVLGAAHRVEADDTFDARAKSAQRVRHVDDLVWAFAAPCDAGTDINQRQCRRLRDTRAKQLAGATLLVEAEREAFAIGPWSAQKKSMELVLSACVRCSGVELDGKTYYVAGIKDGGPAPRFEGGKLRVGQLLDNARTFPNEAAAKKFVEAAKPARIQLLVKVPAKPSWNDGDKRGIVLDVVGYRVYSPCDGNVIVASPKSASVEGDRKACGAAAPAATK